MTTQLSTPTLSLTSEDRQHYQDKGWLVINNVFSAEECIRIRELATEIAEADLESHDANSRAVDSAVDSADDDTALPRKIDAPFTRHAEFRSFVLQDKLGALLHDILGKKALLATDQIFMKPPQHGSEKPFHQDNYYFKVTPANDLITAWIALDDANEENGCLQYIDGSHQGSIIEHTAVPGAEYNLTPSADKIDINKRSFAVVKQGGVVFHHGTALHKSGANNSPNWRRAYATHWVTADAQSESAVLDNAYFKNTSLAT